MAIFIVGAQRSGTTLLRLILNSHPDLAVPEEGTFMMPLLRLYGQTPDREINFSEFSNILKYIRNNHQYRLWKLDKNSEEILELLRRGDRTLRAIFDELYGAYATFHSAKKWVDKTPSFFRMIPKLIKIYPDAKFIHLIRDGRDVYLSWRNYNPSRDNIAVNAAEWRYKNARIEKSLKRIPQGNRLLVHYEDLVTKPVETTKRIFDFIGIDFRQDVLEFWRDSEKYIGKHHSKLIFQPISAESVGRWKEVLNENENAKFESIASDALSENGYIVQQSGYGLGLYLSARLELIRGLPKRLWQVGYTAIRLSMAAKYGISTTLSGSGRIPDR